MNKERVHERDCMNPRDKGKKGEKRTGENTDRVKSEETRRWRDSARESEAKPIGEK